MVIRFLDIKFTKTAMLSLSDSRINCFINCQNNIHYLPASNSVLSSMKREKRQMLIIQYLTTLKASHAVFFRSSRRLIFNTSRPLSDTVLIFFKEGTIRVIDSFLDITNY